MRKIAIVGSNITQEALIDATMSHDWELWSVNNLYVAFPDIEFNRWFELHVIEENHGVYYRRGYRNYPIRSETSVKEYMEQLNSLNCPVYMQKEWEIIKQSATFPFMDIIDAYGDYMGCSFTWMMAQCLAEGVDEVGFFGVGLEGCEYYYQRPSLEYLIGFARGKGIKVYIDETSNLLKANYIYAYKENFDMIYALHGDFANDLAHTILNSTQQYMDNMHYDK